MTIKTAVSAVIAIAGLTLQAAAQLVTPAPQQVSATAPQTDPLAKAAALYATYQGDVTDVKSNGFASANDIEDSLNNLGGHNPEQLTQGWMAYSALVAAQNPEFRAAVLDIEGYYGRDMLMTGMQNDIRSARTLSGGNSAVNQALTAVKADSSRLIGAAAFVKEQAYSLQGAGWAKGRLGNSKAKATSLFASTQTGIPARGSLVQAMHAPEINSVLAQAGPARVRHRQASQCSPSCADLALTSVSITTSRPRGSALGRPWTTFADRISQDSGQTVH